MPVEVSGELQWEPPFRERDRISPPCLQQARDASGQPGSYIEDKYTGEKMLLTEAQGMYMLKTWVKNGPFKRPG